MKRILPPLAATLMSISVLAQPTLINNVKGYTFDENQQISQFTAIAFEHGKVLSTGDETLSANYPEAQVIDGQGKVMLPGLIDAHGHIHGLGQNLLQVNVRDIASAKATVNKVQQYAKQHPELPWIQGRGWNQVLWPDKAYPTAQQLDEHINDKPVWLRRIDGHAGWANSKALEIAGITRDSLDPPGGQILKDAKGNPTGVLIDNAMYMLEKHLPKTSPDALKNALNAAGEHLLSLGITSVHDAGISHSQYQFYQQQAEAGKLPFRVYAMLSATDPALISMLEAGYISDKNGMLSIRSVKAYGDGALGSRGAALLEPYSDMPDNHGLLVTAEKDLRPLFDTVLGHDFQLNFHAIGDRANRLALMHFADSYKTVGGEELRNRIEHAQVVAVEDIPRFKALNIIASMQPTHATSDKNMAADRLGQERLEGAYAWQHFLKQGTIVAAGSDFPVELANPFYGLHAAVTRQDRHNQPEGGWRPQDAMTVEQALRAFTIDAAYAAHQENLLGSLTPGKWADFILIDKDIFTMPTTDLWKPQVLETWLAGERVYQKP